MAYDTENQKYELWSEDGSDAFFPGDSESARATLSPHAKLVCVIEAASWSEAQQKRYDFIGWGRYRTIEEDEAQ